MMKEQFFGIEIEMTGITRRKAAVAINNLWGFGTNYRHIGGSYDEYHIYDAEGRTWKVMSDVSITAERLLNGTDSEGKNRYERVYDSRSIYQVEVVSPKLEWKDIETVQEIVRKLREAGAKANSSCGIHIHVDGKNHNAKSLKNLMMIMNSKEDLIYKALQVRANRERYCQKADQSKIEAVKASKNLDMDRLCNIWYKGNTSNRYQHYDDSRYVALNLHAVWQKGTVEFRMFNSTMHAGRVKAYIHLALAISAQAITQKRASAEKTVTDNPKFTFRTFLLRLGMIGDEFKNTRENLLKNLDGDAAWRNDRSTYACNQRAAN